MQLLRYSINVTLDGCIDHNAIIPTDEMHHHATSLIAKADGLIFGRVIYELMESAWREPAESDRPAEWMSDWMLPFAKTIHAKKKYVVSTTLGEVDWNAELIRGDLAAAVLALKAQPGNGLFTGGVTLRWRWPNLALSTNSSSSFTPALRARDQHFFPAYPNRSTSR